MSDGINAGDVQKYESVDTEPTMVLESISDCDTSSADPELLSIITGNIRGLNPGQTHSKMEFLNDLSKVNNSIIISLTKSHLCDKILDSEVQLDGWSHVRSDRIKRSGGGVITFVKDHLTMSREKVF